MKIWENDNNKIYDNVHFSTESKERILYELMNEIDKKFDDEGVKKEGNVDYTWEIRRNEKMKKNINMKKIMKTSVAAAFAVAASGAIILGVNSYVNSNKGNSTAKQIVTTESVKETVKETEKITEQNTEQETKIETKKEVTYAKVNGAKDDAVEKIGEGFYRLVLNCDDEVVVGDATFKCDKKKGAMVKKDGDFAEIGVKLSEEESELDVFTDGKVVYYDNEAKVFAYDIEAGKAEKVCSIPVKNEEESGSFARVCAFTGDKIIFNAGVGGWWCTEAFVYDKNTKEVSKISDGCVQDINGNNLLVQREYVTDVSPVPYDVYVLDGGKYVKLTTIIEKGNQIGSVNENYYFLEWNEDSLDTHIVRCNLSKGTVEQVLDLTKERKDQYDMGYVSEVTDTYCVYNDVKYTFNK